MLEVTVKNNSLIFGDIFGLNFQRTLRIPDDGKIYPLPPGFGAFPICRVEDYKKKVPSDWVENGGVFIPMYQREALWISFEARLRTPNAVKIAIGKVNAVSGKPWNEELQPDEADYLVCPRQIWLDGINAGRGYIKQFVAMPLGMGYTVEGQVTGKEEFGGIQIIVYEPKPGKFPKEVPGSPKYHGPDVLGEMGLAAGGKMKQKIYPDRYGIETWDQDNYGRVYVHIVNSMMCREITGTEPPDTPITAKTYQRCRLPWFDLYEENMEDIEAPEVLQNVKSVKEMDEEKGFSSQQDDGSIEISDDQVIKYKIGPNEVEYGKW